MINLWATMSWSGFAVAGGALLAVAESPAAGHDLVTVLTVIAGAIATCITNVATTRAEVKKVTDSVAELVREHQALKRDHAELRSSHAELTQRVDVLWTELGPVETPPPPPKRRHHPDGRPVTQPTLLPRNHPDGRPVTQPSNPTTRSKPGRRRGSPTAETD